MLELQHDTGRLEDAYVLAHRLQQFLDDLKRHPDFCQAPQFPLLPRVLEQLAIRIDEEQLNQFVDMSMEPTITEDDDPGWESFEGWPFDVPGCADTSNESSFSNQSSQQSPTQEEPKYESFLEHIATQSVEFGTLRDFEDSSVNNFLRIRFGGGGFLGAIGGQQCVCSTVSSTPESFSEPTAATGTIAGRRFVLDNAGLWFVLVGICIIIHLKKVLTDAYFLIFFVLQEHRRFQKLISAVLEL